MFLWDVPIFTDAGWIGSTIPSRFAGTGEDQAMEQGDAINVLGGTLAQCSSDPVTGFFRDGHCNTCTADQGSHTVCAVMTAEFLAYSNYVGNDLSTPRPEVADETLLAEFARTAIPSTPYAYALDITGETTIGLIEADPMAGRVLEPVLNDRDWVRLQNICS